MKTPFLLASFAALAVWALAVPADAVAADAGAGERAFRQCAGCHSVQAGQNRAGPHLRGVVGRRAGSVEGFRYSRAMTQADIVWTEETLAAYLSNPRRFLPGTRKVVRVRNARRVADLIAYLKSLNGK